MGSGNMGTGIGATGATAGGGGAGARYTTFKLIYLNIRKRDHFYI